MILILVQGGGVFGNFSLFFCWFKADLDESKWQRLSQTIVVALRASKMALKKYHFEPLESMKVDH